MVRGRGHIGGAGAASASATADAAAAAATVAACDVATAVAATSYRPMPSPWDCGTYVHLMSIKQHALSRGLSVYPLMNPCRTAGTLLTFKTNHWTALDL